MLIRGSYNLMDHPATYAVFKYPGVGEAYNYSDAYDNPNPQDAQKYLGTVYPPSPLTLID